jgi:hypothetical protein
MVNSFSKPLVLSLIKDSFYKLRQKLEEYSHHFAALKPKGV